MLNFSKYRTTAKAVAFTLVHIDSFIVLLFIVFTFAQQ